MKHLILISGIVLISVSSCQKHSSAPINNNATINHENLAVIDDYGNDVRQWAGYDDPCVDVKSNCIEVVVTGLADKYAMLDAAILEGPTAIGEFFTDQDNWVVFPTADIIDKTALASGTYDIIKQPNSHPAAKDNYYLCGSTGSLTVASPEFVIGVTLVGE